MKSYFSLIKFAHTVFALPFALLAFFLGLKLDHSVFSLTLIGLILLCMIFARSAAMAFNRYIDRGYDAINARTLGREIPSGIIKPSSAILFVALMSVAFMFTTFWINPLCFYLSPIALLVILGYSYTKRFTWLCHFVLGIGLGLAPVGAFLAVTGRFHFLPILYGIMVMLWVSGFDIIYALQDEEFDKINGLHSIPGRFGNKTANQISIALHFVCAGILFFITWYQNQLFPSLGFLHWIGAIGFASLLFWQHHLVKLNDLSKINQAFFETNGIASILFGSAVIIDVLM
ncbi:MAG: UbiA family prenyltransferase [Saprospiraceae bacterium]|uniref:4-hydroxybenzoate polyprenyltransferase n=1 Tax=Candidatus Opimibacter skivensis TaxID=2982028 RepID=A0A9D7XMT5_9BACT|nr:UbiA family prenyltransferase [Candidatus Opimibacter skivensis]